MPDSLRPQRDVALLHLETLIRRGRELQQPPSGVSLDDRPGDMRAWQQQCADAIHHLSGGSKAHWLSRAFSDALLVRSIDGAAVAHAPVEEIARRLVDVLLQARSSLTQMDSGEVPAAASAPPQRFTFVHRRELQPILEHTYADSREAFDRGDFALALVLSCGVLDAIITDALEHAERRDEPSGAATRVADLPFDARIAAAERAGLIGGGCRRLPAPARRYRDLLDQSGVLRHDAVAIGRDARLAGQVLRVVIRDLDPGR